MKVIMTKYFGPNNTRGSCIVAREESGFRATVEYDPGLSSIENHGQAVRKLCKRMKWSGKLQGAHWLQGSMVWVWTWPQPYEHDKLTWKPMCITIKKEE